MKDLSAKTRREIARRLVEIQALADHARATDKRIGLAAQKMREGHAARLKVLSGKLHPGSRGPEAEEYLKLLRERHLLDRLS